MLSRDADSCYWIGRYVERAEATARMVDVHFHAALEAPLQPRAEGAAGDEPVQAISKPAALNSESERRMVG